LRIYEGMFVLDDKRANDNWDGVTADVRRLLEKHQGEVLSLERWDERRLAYRIKGRNRAVYLLARFTAPCEAIPPLERDCKLNDTILRVLFVRDHEGEKLVKTGVLRLPGQEEPEPQPQDAAPQPQPTPDTPAATPEPPSPEGDQPPPAAPQAHEAQPDTPPTQEPAPPDQPETPTDTP